MTARDYLREFAQCVRASPGFMVERLEALVAEMEQAEAERRAELEEARRVIRQMTDPDVDLGPSLWADR